MKRIAALLLISAFAVSACDRIDGGPRKVIVNERVCSDTQLLRLNLGETNKIVLDNSEHGETQDGILFRLIEFPMIIRGTAPVGTSYRGEFVTTALEAAPGEEASMEVEPIYTGEFRAECNVTLKRGTSNAIVQKVVLFQFVD